MSQYTFSYINSEYDRIPLELKENLDSILAESDADERTKKLVAQICKAMNAAVGDLALYAQDQLKL
jgi:hypothetical protein